MCFQREAECCRWMERVVTACAIVTQSAEIEPSAHRQRFLLKTDASALLLIHGRARVAAAAGVWADARRTGTRSNARRRRAA